MNAKFPGSASESTAAAVRVAVPKGFEDKTVDLMAQLEGIEVIPVRRARVVINERTGAVVAGGDVRLAPASTAISPITVKEAPVVSQPQAAFGTGDTKVVQRSDVKVDDEPKDVTYMKGAPTLADARRRSARSACRLGRFAGVLQALRAANALEARHLWSSRPFANPGASARADVEGTGRVEEGRGRQEGRPGLRGHPRPPDARADEHSAGEGGYGDMATEALSSAMTKGGGLGLSKMIEQQLAPRERHKDGRRDHPSAAVSAFKKVAPAEMNPISPAPGMVFSIPKKCSRSESSCRSHL